MLYTYRTPLGFGTANHYGPGGHMAVNHQSLLLDLIPGSTLQGLLSPCAGAAHVQDILFSFLTSATRTPTSSTDHHSLLTDYQEKGKSGLEQRWPLQHTNKRK